MFFRTDWCNLRLHSQQSRLSPTKEKVAFPYGKVIATTDDAWVEPGEVFCGFSVEKGLGPEAEAAVTKKTEIMDDKWFWHRFLELANVPFASAAEASGTAIDGPVYVFVAMGPLAKGAKWDRLLFRAEPSGLTQVWYHRHNDRLSALSTSTTFESLAMALRGLDSCVWEWVDVLAGAFFTQHHDGPNDLDKCAALLMPFRSWMRPAP